MNRPPLSTARPSSYVARPYMTRRITDMICDFLNEYSFDAFLLERESDELGYITVCAEGLAYFIKSVFSAVFGKSVISIVFSSSEDQYHLRFSFKTPTLLDNDTIQNLRSIAHASGMTLTAGAIDGETILQLKAAKRPAYHFSVYARGDNDMARALRVIFFGY